jgi:hypothetical protein
MPETASLVPEWASFMDQDEYRLFMTSIGDCLDARSIKYVFSSDSVSFCPGADGGFGEAAIGLSNLAKWCKDSGQESYRDLIEEHFERLAGLVERSNSLEQTVADFESCKDLLGVRIYPGEHFDEMSKEPVAIELADGLMQTLVLDTPEAVRPVTFEEIDVWSKSVEELLAVGRDNIRRNYVFEVIKYEDLPLLLVATDHFFAANIVFDLPDREDLLGKYGSLMAFPTRDCAIVYPINDSDALFALVQLMDITESMYSDGQGSLSSSVFWYRSGMLTNVSSSKVLIDGELARMSPPPEFMNLLGEISADREASNNDKVTD